MSRLWLSNGKWKVRQYSVWAESAIFMCPAPFLPLYDHFEIWRSLDGSGTNSWYLVLWQLLKSKDRRKGELIKVNLLFKWNRKKEKSDTLLLFKKNDGNFCIWKGIWIFNLLIVEQNHISKNAVCKINFSCTVYHVLRRNEVNITELYEKNTLD